MQQILRVDCCVYLLYTIKAWMSVVYLNREKAVLVPHTNL